jgi:hypothetical protein
VLAAAGNFESPLRLTAAINVSLLLLTLPFFAVVAGSVS